MSILIKNMEMPKGCGCCSMASHCESLLRKIEQTDDELWIPLNYILDDCPLVEIPLSHGRLIDIDDAIESYGGNAELEYVSQAKFLNVIIEAEGEG